MSCFPTAGSSGMHNWSNPSSISDGNLSSIGSTPSPQLYQHVFHQQGPTNSGDKSSHSGGYPFLTSNLSNKNMGKELKSRPYDNFPHDHDIQSEFFTADAVSSSYAKEHPIERNHNQFEDIPCEFTSIAPAVTPQHQLVKYLPNLIAHPVLATPQCAFPAESCDFYPVDPYAHISPSYVNPEMFYDVPPMVYGIHPFYPSFRHSR